MIKTPATLRRSGASIEPDAGFTLLEVLVAVAIVALLAVLGYRALSALSRSEERLAAEAIRWRNLDLFFARLEGDLRQAQPRPVRLGDSIEPAMIGAPSDIAGDTTLAFSRAGPEFDLEPGSGGQRLGYRFRDGAVEVLYWTGFDRPRGVEPATFTLIDGVTRFHVSYLSSSGTWIDTWPPTRPAELPRAVRVQLVLSSGEAIERWLALR